MKFAELKMRTIMKLMAVEIDEFFITAEAMAEIKSILNLEGKTADELTAIRNTVVKTLDDEFITPALEENSIEDFRKYNTQMSGITATIDNELFKMGALY